MKVLCRFDFSMFSKLLWTCLQHEGFTITLWRGYDLFLWQKRDFYAKAAACYKSQLTVCLNYLCQLYWIYWQNPYCSSWWQYRKLKLCRWTSCEKFCLVYQQHYLIPLHNLYSCWRKEILALTLDWKVWVCHGIYVHMCGFHMYEGVCVWYVSLPNRKKAEVRAHLGGLFWYQEQW